MTNTTARLLLPLLAAALFAAGCSRTPSIWDRGESMPPAMSEDDAADNGRTETARSDFADDPGISTAPPQEGDDDRRAREMLQDREDNMTITEQERRATSRALTRKAREFYTERNFHEARELLQEAVALDPTNHEADELLARVEMMLGARPREIELIKDAMTREGEIRRRQKEVEARAAFEEGMEAYENENWERALERFDVVRSILTYSAYAMNLDDLESRVDEMIAETRENMRASEIRRRRSEQEAADRLARLEEQKRLQQVAETIKRHFESALEQFERRQFENAATLAERILKIDPHNVKARELKHDSIRAQLRADDEQYLRERVEAWNRVMDDIRRSSIPYADILTWPSPEFRQKIRNSPFRRPQSLGDEEETLSDDILAQKRLLETKTVLLEFSGSPLDEVAELLSTYTGVNIVVNEDKILDEIGELPEVDLRVSSPIRAQDALDLIMKFTGLAYKWEEGGILMITTPLDAGGNLVTQLHDIRDLVQGLSDFPGPTITLGDGDDDAGAGFFGDDDGGGEATFDEDALLDLIQETVDPESWDEIDGAAINLVNQQLVIRHNMDVHREVGDLLDRLRRFSGSVVTIESRFLQIADDFLEEIGVDWRGLGAGTIGTPAGLDDVLNGAPDNSSAGNDNPAIAATHPFAGAFFADGNTADFRGRTENILSSRPNGVRFPGSFGSLTNTGGLALQYSHVGDTEIQYMLRAIKASQRATFLTQPVLTVFNTQRANVTLVNQIAYIEDFDVEVAAFARIADPLVATLQDGIVLDVRPIISIDRRYITLELRPTVARLTNMRIVNQQLAAGVNVGIEAPEMSLQQARTTVRVPDGGTILIGGLKDTIDSEITAGVPVLGEMPILSHFFKTKSTGHDRRNLMIIIKATITEVKD